MLPSQHNGSSPVFCCFGDPEMDFALTLGRVIESAGLIDRKVERVQTRELDILIQHRPARIDRSNLEWLWLGALGL